MKKITGIYKIENTINGKFYIGCSGDIAKRWKYHVRGYGNKYLYNAIKKYGKDSFIFVVLEECKMEEIYIKEKQWMERLRPVYNLIQSIEGCYQHSEETIKKLSELNKGKNNPQWNGGWTLDAEKVRKYKKAYEKTPKRKAYKKSYMKAYKKTPKRKAYMKAYIKGYMKAYRLKKKMERLNNESKL